MLSVQQIMLLPGESVHDGENHPQGILVSAAGVAAGIAMPTAWRSGRAFAQAAVTLKLGHPDTPIHPTQSVAMRFSELVAAKTGGAVKIQVFSGGQLGSEVNMG